MSSHRNGNLGPCGREDKSDVLHSSWTTGKDMIFGAGKYVHLNYRWKVLMTNYALHARLPGGTIQVLKVSYSHLREKSRMGAFMASRASSITPSY